VHKLYSALMALVLIAGSQPAAVQAAPGCPDDVGAALAAACPCDADSSAQAWKNHGQYQKCVVHFRNDMRKQGCLDSESQRSIARCSARSTCGKDGAVLCCVYDTSGTCNDPAPGDGTAAGVCSNAATTPCDTDADCITASAPRVSRHADTCVAHGGTPVGGGSVCSDCPLPPPAP